MKNNVENVNIIKLRSISNEIELGMIKEILDDNNIPYIIKNHGSGGYIRIITGGSSFATDVMVKESDFDKSNNLLESIGLIN